ncbi:hypothetical protein [Rhizobium laguerreae]|uniref:hypothetical protein n=1 Tax=Rhizobium laguerreae TaxID=1076926 RepID=UPI001C9052A0|nr:hypothetical protein [Rhizobium laguerreae]MBY3494547.1 hypothetical protein [Rhizobium laguerreae]
MSGNHLWNWLARQRVSALDAGGSGRRRPCQIDERRRVDAGSPPHVADDVMKGLED